MSPKVALQNWISGRVFKFVHGRNLVYNTCWEDPRLDRVALELGPNDTIAMITSAGCNALDYVLQSPKHIYCVDMNPRQNALLELKQAGIRSLEFDTFFNWFGRGRCPHARLLYDRHLREQLTPASREFWDRNVVRFFGDRNPPRRTFYFRGTSGAFARIINYYIDVVARVRPKIDALLNAKSVEEQREIYEAMREVFWKRVLRWFLRQDSTLSLVGVPRPQRMQVERNYQGGIAKFVEDCVETVFAKLPLHDNYFWRVYLTGEYSPKCCPEYLKPENFVALKEGLVNRISTHTGSLLDVLKELQQPVSRFILLDHMDWLASFNKDVLAQEWQAIIDRATPEARILFRSGGLEVDYVDNLPVVINGEKTKVGEHLVYNRELAAQLHEKDRVHTYGSFYVADLKR